MYARVHHYHLMNIDVDDEIEMETVYDLDFYTEQRREINRKKKIKEARQACLARRNDTAQAALGIAYRARVNP